MNQTGWNPPISQFIRVKILLLKWLSVEIRYFFHSTGLTSSTFPFQPDFSQNQPAAITLIKYRFSRAIAWLVCNVALNNVMKTGDLINYTLFYQICFCNSAVPNVWKWRPAVSFYSYRLWPSSLRKHVVIWIVTTIPFGDVSDEITPRILKWESMETWLASSYCCPPYPHPACTHALM
jgi:hypothetical protein